MRRRLIVTTTALVAVALVALAVPLAVAVRGVLTNQAFDAVQGVAEQASLLVDATTRSCSELQLRVAQLGDAPATVTVAAADRTLVATTAPTGAAAQLATGPFSEAAAGRVGRTVTDERLVVAMPLSTAVCGRPLVLQATQPGTPLAERIRAAWAAIAAGALVVAGGAAAFAAWYGRRIARPFEALAEAAGSLGEGDFSARAPRSGIEEADAIATALDGTADRLGRAVERASAFTADASHQLRTPLTALRLQLDTAEALTRSEAGAGDSEALRDALAAAHTEADRIGATIEDLVALTRLDTPDAEVDLIALVHEQLPGWRARAEESGREVEVATPASVPAVRVRPGAISQVLQVLVDNALTHADGDLRVEVTHITPSEGSAASVPAEPSTAPEQHAAATGVVRVCVHDQGGGAQPRDDGEDRYDRPGGKGLPLARALAAAEGGRLTISSEAGGTRACLVLPITTASS